MKQSMETFNCSEISLSHSEIKTCLPVLHAGIPEGILMEDTAGFSATAKIVQ